MLRRFLRLCEMLIGNLQVMVLCDFQTVADPLANNVCGELLAQFRLASRPQVVERLRPRDQSRLADDAMQLRSQIAIRLPVSRDNVLASRLGFGEYIHQRAAQLRKHRDNPFVAAFMVLGFWRRYANRATVKINVAPFQAEMLRWAAKPAIAAQGEQ
ncbi:MAG: hypothetical protein ABSG31_04785 [Tepidisphaeraceae bacterium]